MSNVQTNEYFAAAVFRSDKDGLCPMVPFSGTIGVGNNSQVIAAVAGKSHKIISASFCSGGGGVSTGVFKSNNGTQVFAVTLPAATTSEKPNEVYLFNPNGWFETVAGEKLSIDVGTTGLTLSLQYITYTP